MVGHYKRSKLLAEQEVLAAAKDIPVVVVNPTTPVGPGDWKPTPTGFYVIDFNKAYNPTCAYNPTWECPYPPQANRLKVAIRAGERAPAEGHDDIKAPAA